MKPRFPGRETVNSTSKDVSTEALDNGAGEDRRNELNGTPNNLPVSRARVSVNTFFIPSRLSWHHPRTTDAYRAVIVFVITIPAA